MYIYNHQMEGSIAMVVPPKRVIYNGTTLLKILQFDYHNQIWKLLVTIIVKQGGAPQLSMSVYNSNI